MELEQNGSAMHTTRYVWVPKIRGTFLGGPKNKDYNISGSILGSPYFGKLPYDGCLSSLQVLNCYGQCLCDSIPSLQKYFGEP